MRYRVASATVTKKSYVAENGITLGLAGLALLVVFAIALPRWTHHQDTKAINFPDSVGGMSLVNATNTPQAATYLDSFTKLDQSTIDAMGVASKSAVYVNQQSGQTLIVQAVRKPGGLLLLSQPGGTVSKVGSDECMANNGVDQTTGQPTSSALCVRSEGNLTLQVAGTGTAASIDSSLDEVWKKIR